MARYASSPSFRDLSFFLLLSLSKDRSLFFSLFSFSTNKGDQHWAQQATFSRFPFFMCGESL